MIRIGFVCLVVWAAALVGFRLAPAAGAGEQSNYNCPNAPAGWTGASGGPQYWGPDQNPGADVERITCGYLNAKDDLVTLAVNFALPTDPNPWNDFDYGCGGLGAVAWSDSQRIYQSVSPSYWMDVSFTDPQNLISSGEVGSFEGVAKDMMTGAQGSAHPCAVKIAPTSTLAGWLFDFEFELRGKGVVAFGGIGTHTPAQGAVLGVSSYAVPDGSFHVKTMAHSSKPVVASLSAPSVGISVHERGGVRHAVTIKLTQGTAFSFKELPDNRSATSSLVVSVRVIGSTLPGCAVGSRGTLSLATMPSAVSLNLCGAVFDGLKSQAPTVTIQQS